MHARRVCRSPHGGSNDSRPHVRHDNGRPPARCRSDNHCRRRRRQGQAGDVEPAGYFHQAAWQGNVSFNISPYGPKIQRMSGILPGTCHDKRTGRLVRAGPDGAIGMQFDARPNAVIRPNGTFSFTAKVSSASGITPHTVTVGGTFYGNNVLGRARGRSTTAKYDRYSNCSGNQPFWAKRIG